MQRLQEVAEVRAATESGSVVISCAYAGRVPEEIRSQLSDDVGRQFVARVENGRVVHVVRGLPETVILGMLPGAEGQTRAE